MHSVQSDALSFDIIQNHSLHPVANWADLTGTEAQDTS